ncbi:hypothetical protein DMN91_011848 [Ooceraea biroi]|uniref:Double jelly roll-like domain-containing protein n=1 Tax=Ooceraea biroi TaxID=2015173 RepID=A0A3L8D6N8_OOCBI|nr:hypothetical protein DMN91_011848 [Ooceraea biroi]
MGFRSWDLYELDEKNVSNEDITVFNDCKLTNMKLYLNSECYPYDDMNLDFDRGRYAILYEMYSRFRKAYYGNDCDETLLTTINFLIRGPFVVIEIVCDRTSQLRAQPWTSQGHLRNDCPKLKRKEQQGCTSQPTAAGAVSTVQAAQDPSNTIALVRESDKTYVDDVLFGGDDLPSVRQMRDQLVSLLRRGGFELRKWASNSRNLLSDIDPANHGLACTKTLDR